MPQPSTGYTVGFAAALCFVASLFVSGAAVMLKDKQEENKVLDRQSKVLGVAGLMEKGESLTPEEIQSRFDKNITPLLVSLESGKVVETAGNGQTAAEYDQLKATKDPELRRRHDTTRPTLVVTHPTPRHTSRTHPSAPQPTPACPSFFRELPITA